MTDLTERTRLTQALVELGMRMFSKLNLDEVMQSALDGFVAALRADAGDINIYTGDDWVVRYQCGFGPEAVGLHLSTPEAPVATRVMQLREPVVVEDYLAEPPEFYVGFPLVHHLRAVMAVPLIVREEVVGCLFAWMKDDPRAFSPDELEFARRVAGSVALALENARLFSAEQEARNRAEAAEHDLERELARTRVLLRASDELLTATDPDELLRRLASVVLDATGMTRVFINLIDVRERVLIPKIATGGLSAPSGDSIPFERLSETARKAIANGKPVVLDYERPDTPASDRAIAEANAARLVLSVPLVYQGVVVGQIAIDEPGVRYDFSAEQIRVVSSIAAQAAVALQSARLAAERTIELLEQQLRWIAYSLHDGPMQTLSAAGAMLEQTGRSGELDAMRAQVAASEGLLDYALFEMREIMSELRPVELDEGSLVAKIREYAAAYEKRWGIPVRINAVGTEPPVRHHVQVSLFRAVQEALSNARKHANAQSVEVDICFSPGTVECAIRDNGDGFDSDRASLSSASSHWGLASMRERLLMIGGELEITSAVGEGTEVRARAPLDSVGEAADERAR